MPEVGKRRAESERMKRKKIRRSEIENLGGP
jgi:hypothetical protein